MLARDHSDLRPSTSGLGSYSIEYGHLGSAREARCPSANREESLRLFTRYSQTTLFAMAQVQMSRPPSSSRALSSTYLPPWGSLRSLQSSWHRPWRGSTTQTLSPKYLPLFPCPALLQVSRQLQRSLRTEQQQALTTVCVVLSFTCEKLDLTIPSQCAALSFVLGSKVSYPLGISYISSLATYWSQQESQLVPSCIVSPKSTQDVSAAVYALSLPNAETTCKFAIRSAGHTPWAGAANIQSGVTIDLGAMKAVNVNAARTVTSIEPGARWVDVYLKLDAMSLAVPGGRVADVGVGGLVTGGS